MPNKLKVLLAIMALSTILAAINQSWVSLIINVLLVIGILQGSEGVRTLLLGLAFIGLCFSIFILVTAVIAADPLASPIFLAVGALAFAQNAFFIWCLRQQEVQAWMFHRKMQGIDPPPSL